MNGSEEERVIPPPRKYIPFVETEKIVVKDDIKINIGRAAELMRSHIEFNLSEKSRTRGSSLGEFREDLKSFEDNEVYTRDGLNLKTEGDTLNSYKGRHRKQ